MIMVSAILVVQIDLVIEYKVVQFASISRDPIAGNQ